MTRMTGGFANCISRLMTSMVNGIDVNSNRLELALFYELLLR